MHFSITLLLALLAATCLGLGTEWANLISRGRQRTARIAAATSDTSRSDDLSTWYVDTSKGQVDFDDAYQYLSDINQAGSLGLSDQVADVYTFYPKDVEEEDPESMYASYSLFFDPHAGAVVAGNVYNKPGVRADRSTADVAWSLYRQQCSSQRTLCTNLATILVTEITSDFAQALFDELWNANGVDHTRPLVFTNLNSDEALAIMGLDTGAMVDGLLEYHNVAMGKKEMVSVSLWPDTTGKYNVWWKLRASS